MQIIDTPQLRSKIAIARQYGDRVKSISAAYNTELSKIWTRHLSLLKKAVLTGEDTSYILNSLIRELRILLARVIEGCIDLSCEREEVDRDTYSMLIPLSVPQCNVDYYEHTLSKYGDTLQQELDFAIGREYIEDIDLFLLNPMLYMSKRDGGLVALKEGVTEVSKGVSYSILDNLKKLGISVAALSYANAQMELWKDRGDMIGYMGVRNSNYPCPLCDSYANRFIPMSEGMVYPLHNRCVCSIIPLRQSELQE